MDPCVLEPLALFDLNLMIISLFMGRDNFSARILDSLLNPAVLVTPCPLVAGVVKDIDIFRPCIYAMPDYLLYQLGIGIPTSFRGNIPSDVGFYNNILIWSDIPSDPSKGLDRLIKHHVRLCALDSNHIADLTTFSLWNRFNRPGNPGK
jgi:hypothetical protein